MKRIVMDLQFFADETGAAAAAPETGGETAAVSENAAVTGTEQSAPIREGDTLPDGTKVPSARVAAELERQMKRHPELRKVYGQPAQGQQAEAQAAPAQGAAGNQPEDTIQARWEAAKKGEFKDLYGQDVQNAIRDRFKNQKDLQGQIDAIQPMLDVLMDKAGVESVEELSDLIMNDDSLYEDEAEEAGMTVERYKQFKALQDEHDRREQEDAENEERAFWADHFDKLTRDAEALKQTFPNFDLSAEMENETFRRLTMPGSGVSLEDAYYTIHRKELGPQIMAYGMNRARQQMGQTIQAQRARPAEGAMRGQGSVAADMKVDFSKLSRKERDEYRRLVHAGKKGGTFA